MTLTGADYLLRLSALAVSFVGFAAVVVALRRALGADLSALHMYFVRFFIEGGLAVAAFGLLPGALSFTGLANLTIWRLSSAAAAFMFSVYFIFLFRRRRRVTIGPIQLQTRVAFAMSITATLALWVNTVGFGFQPSAAAYALALTWLLVVGGWVFVQNLGLFFGEAPSR
jgi:hypothetical protein